MKKFDRLERRWATKRYIHRKVAAIERENAAKLRAATGLSRTERWNLENQLAGDLFEWWDWLQEIEDKDSVKRAAKMDVHLEDIPVPEITDKELEKGHYRTTPSYQNRVLRDESRKALLAAMRARAPIYRKERREVVELYVKAAASLVGVIGAVTGLVAVCLK